MVVDDNARTHLEILRPLNPHQLSSAAGSHAGKGGVGKQGSLLWAVDRTVTAMGSRLLCQWLLQPLMDVQAIQARQDAVSELLELHSERDSARRVLRAHMGDMERVCSRCVAERASPRDLVVLARSCAALGPLADITALSSAPALANLRNGHPELSRLAARIQECLDSEESMRISTQTLSASMLLTRNVRVVKAGVDAHLDQLRAVQDKNTEWLASFVEKEREKTGIASLRLGHSKNFGFYIAITCAAARKQTLPSSYRRRQTLTNEERFTTPELSAREGAILQSKERAARLEIQIFEKLRSDVGSFAPVIRMGARAAAELDVYAGFAVLALEEGYVRPTLLGRTPSADLVPKGADRGSSSRNSSGSSSSGEVLSSSSSSSSSSSAAAADGGAAAGAAGGGGEHSNYRQIAIVDGRHPVVEQLRNHVTGGDYVPNSCHLGGARGEGGEGGEGMADVMILTGPNAAGKSCFLRQIGLIQLMAQVGCFVPASSAVLGVCDRLFTRVGAVDDLAGGRSTFVVEMSDVATMLQHATERSLVLLDEVGRGTSSVDGMCIAQAILEYVVGVIRCRGVFATHYHHLTKMPDSCDRLANFSMGVREVNCPVTGGKTLVFLYDVLPTPTNKSYGFEVAQMAGIPAEVVQRARELSKEHLK